MSAEVTSQSRSCLNRSNPFSVPSNTRERNKAGCSVAVTSITRVKPAC